MSHQLLGEQSRWWGCRGHGSQGLMHLLRHSGGTVRSRCQGWSRPLEGEGGCSCLLTCATSAEMYLLYGFFQGTAMWLLPGVEEKGEIHSKSQSVFCVVSLPPALTVTCWTRSQVSTPNCTSSWSAKAISKEAFSNLHLEMIRHSSLP